MEAKRRAFVSICPLYTLFNGSWTVVCACLRRYVAGDDDDGQLTGGMGCLCCVRVCVCFPFKPADSSLNQWDQGSADEWQQRGKQNFDALNFPRCFGMSLTSLIFTRRQKQTVWLWTCGCNPVRILCVFMRRCSRVWVALSGRLDFDTLLVATPPLNTPTTCHASCSCCASMQEM